MRDLLLNWQGLVAEIEDVRNVGRQLLARFRQPDRVQMCAHEVAVRQLDRRRTHDAADDRVAAVEIILVVRRLRRAIGYDQRRLARPPRPSGALRIIGRGRRDVAEIDRVQR